MLNKIIKPNLKNPNWNQTLCQISNKLKRVSDNADFEAQEIASFISGKSSVWFASHGADDVPSTLLKKIEAITARRLDGESLYYILEQCEFCGLTISINKNVLIPRPETEMLVKAAISSLNNIVRGNPRTFPRPLVLGGYASNNKQIRILDIGTGSGAIAVAIGCYCARHKIDTEIVASDISKPALAVARKNSKRYRLNNIITLIQSDLLEGISRQARNDTNKFDIVIANLPYLTDEQCRNLPDPKLALFGGGNDGFGLIAKLLHQIKSKGSLQTGGVIILEIGHNHEQIFRQKVRSLFPNSKINITKDLNGYPRIAIITLS